MTDAVTGKFAYIVADFHEYNVQTLDEIQSIAFCRQSKESHSSPDNASVEYPLVANTCCKSSS